MINDEINVLCYLLVVGFSLSRIGILGVMTANTYLSPLSSFTQCNEM